MVFWNASERTEKAGVQNQHVHQPLHQQPSITFHCAGVLLMKPFNREKFLLWLLAGLLGWQASLFTYGTVMCANVKHQTQQDVCT